MSGVRIRPDWLQLHSGSTVNGLYKAVFTSDLDTKERKFGSSKVQEVLKYKAGRGLASHTFSLLLHWLGEEPRQEILKTQEVAFQ